MAEPDISLLLTNELPVDQDYADHRRRILDAEWKEYVESGEAARLGAGPGPTPSGTAAVPPDAVLSVGGREEAPTPAAGAGQGMGEAGAPTSPGAGLMGRTDTFTDTTALRAEVEGKREVALSANAEMRAAQAAAGTPLPAAAPPKEKPWAEKVALDTAGLTSRQGINAIVGALGKLVIPLEGESRNVMEAARVVLMEGAMPILFAPVVGVIAGVGQRFENLAPEIATAELFQGGPGGPAFTARHLAAGAPAIRTIPPDALKQMQAPMTVREGVELVAQFVPGIIPAAAKVRTAVQMQAPTLRGQRGSVGPQPPPKGAQTSGLGPQPREAGAQYRGAAPAPDVRPAQGGVTPRRPYYEMTLEELDTAVTAAKADDVAVLREVFGEAGGKKYAGLQRAANQTTDLKRADAATKQIAEMERGLTPEQRRRLFQSDDPTTVAEFQRAIGQVSGDTPADLGASIRYAITKVTPGVDPATLPLPAQVAYAQIRRALEIAKARGWDTKAVSDAALKGAAERFGPDAAVMLEDFLKKPTPEAAPAPAALPPPAGGAAPPGAAAPGPVPGEARINAGRLSAEDAVKRVAVAVNALQAEALAGRRATRTHAEVIQKADALKLTVEKALAIDPDTVPLAEAEAYQQAFRDLNLASDLHLKNLAERVRAGDPTARAALQDAYLVSAELSQKQEIFGSHFARGTESRRIGAETGRATFDPAAFAALRDRMGTAEGMDAETLANRLLAIPRANAAQQMGWVRATVNSFRLGLNAANSVWINFLLSNPVTHAANVAGTSLMHLYELAERPVAGVVGEISRGVNIWRDRPPGDHVRLAETNAMILGMGQGIVDGLRLAGMALKEPWRDVQVNPNLSPAMQQAATALLERQRIELKPFSAEAYGFDPANGFGQIVDTVGAIGHRAALPTQLLGAEDAIQKGLAFNMELRALARREAMARGTTGRARARLEADLVANPTPDLIQGAVDAAFLRTLNAELGTAGQAFMKAMNETPGGRLVFPFIRTPTNAAKFTIQRAPVLSAFSKQNWDDILYGSGPARERAIARVALGAGVGAAVYYMVGDGLIIGQGPVDQRLRRDFFAAPKDERTPRRMPNSFLVGDTYYSLDRLDPVLGSMVSTMATAAEIIGQLPETPADADEEYDYRLQLAWASATAASRVMVNKTYLRGLSEFIESLVNPATAGARFLSSLGASVVPAGVRQYQTRYADDGVMRDFRNLVSRVKAATPGYSADVPPRVHRVTGDPVYYPPGLGPDLMSPVTYGMKAEDVVLDELVLNKVAIRDWPRYLGGAKPEEAPITDPLRSPGVTLTLAQRHRLATIVTSEVTVKGMTQYEYVKDLIQSDLYQRFDVGPDTTRATLLHGAFDTFLKLGIRQLRDEDQELDRKLGGIADERLGKKLPVEHPRSRRSQQQLQQHLLR